MVDILSRGPGDRREDARARSMIERNRGTIEKIADQISNGAYSAARAAKTVDTQPKASGLIVSDLGAARASSTPRPYVRVSPNGRVVVVDDETSRQMHFLGEIRRVDGQARFVLATRANGFFSAADEALAERLAGLDGAAMGGERTDRALASEISALLGYA